MTIKRLYPAALLLFTVLLSCTALAQKPTNTTTSGRAGNSPPVPAQQSEGYRELLLRSLQTLEQATLMSGNLATLEEIQSLQIEVQLIDAQTLELMAASAPPLELLQDRLTRAEELMEIAIAETQSGGNTRTIEFPDPEPSVAACSLVNATGTFAIFDVWSVVREILAATRWVCIQEIAGFNSAEDCTVESVLENFYKFSYLAATSCLEEQRDAYLEAILETDENIADHLSDFVDATTSSRASQDSVDDVQTDVTTNIGLLDNLETSLSSDLTSIEDELSTVLADLDDLADDATDLASITDDIQFRVQENQVDVEDAQTRAADAQETAEEIRTDTQSIISSLTDLQTSLDSIELQLTGSLMQSSKAALVVALADPESQVVRFQLPQSAGGELELAREVVIATITAYGNLGANTDTALSILADGDVAYNQQDYLTAYRLFALAYQSLTDNGNGIRRISP